MLGYVILGLSVLLVFVPLVGGYGTLVPGVLAFLARGTGLMPALAGVGINGIHLLFFSDFLRFNAASGMRDGVWTPVVIYVLLILVQLGAGILLGMRRFLPVASDQRSGAGPSRGST
ncbi:hypothetical protein SIID45300_00756 [Candidatus Magnetaquicoccaceae bacterium FCR-1]|uniref:Uncharacterized protein n=1 Tax=Candidatus Magnetaquiglobus chichijimensis TaxID=3141448 RepID=A0ABQ0C6D7_9PROT